MSNMTIDVEFLAGTKIEDAIREAKEKALDFDVAYVRFRFNGCKFSIGRNADLDQVAADFRSGFDHIIRS